jgi:hypothetical protein
MENQSFGAARGVHFTEHAKTSMGDLSRNSRRGAVVAAHRRGHQNHAVNTPPQNGDATLHSLLPAAD